MFVGLFLSMLACFGSKKGDLPNGYTREFADTFVEECKADGGRSDQARRVRLHRQAIFGTRRDRARRQGDGAAARQGEQRGLS